MIYAILALVGLLGVAAIVATISSARWNRRIEEYHAAQVQDATTEHERAAEKATIERVDESLSKPLSNKTDNEVLDSLRRKGAVKG
jgi:hypothetical protein